MSLTSAQPGTLDSLGRAPVNADPDQVTGLTALWRSVLPTEAEIRAARRRLHLKAIFIAALVSASYWSLVIADSSLLLRFASAAVLVTGLIATATSIMHDANHGAFSRSQRLDRVVSYVADGLGTSSFMWRFKHNVLHHGATNVEGIDSDIDQPPFARLSPGQPWRRWHRYQHIYLWPLYGFMALKNLLIGDLRNVITGRIGPQEMRHRPAPTDIVRIVVGKVAHIAVFLFIPLLFNTWWAVLAFYVTMSWVVGLVLAVTFQLAHCVDEVAAVDESEPHRGAAFIPHQLRTTANIASPVPVAGHLFRWIVGGLDHQIEHHLAPRLPHTIYPSLGRRFRAQCLEHGFDHKRHHGIWPAIASHARWLHQMGRPVATPA